MTVVIDSGGSPDDAAAAAKKKFEKSRDEARDGARGWWTAGTFCAMPRAPPKQAALAKKSGTADTGGIPAHVDPDKLKDALAIIESIGKLNASDVGRLKDKAASLRICPDRSDLSISSAETSPDLRARLPTSLWS